MRRGGEKREKKRKKRGQKFSPAIDALPLLAQRAGTRQSKGEGRRVSPRATGALSRRQTRPRWPRSGGGGRGSRSGRCYALAALSRSAERVADGKAKARASPEGERPPHPWGHARTAVGASSPQPRSLDVPAASVLCQGTSTIARRLPNPSALPGDGQGKGGRAGEQNAPRVPSNCELAACAVLRAIRSVAPNESCATR